MRRADAATSLDRAQAQTAEFGIKAMIPVGRPFLDYGLSGLADAGCAKVCLVIGPEHDAIRAYYEGAARPTRLSISFAVQQRPLGTADAVLAAESFAGGDSVVMVNSDNYYPPRALAALAALPRAGLVGFRQSALLAGSSIPPERIRAFALISVTRDRALDRIVEKPDAAEAAAFGADPLVSMNAWLLPPTIYDACRAVRPSRRGELELQDAVRSLLRLRRERFLVVESNEPVLDLSSRSDIPVVAERLRNMEVRL